MNGRAIVIRGDALRLPLRDNSVDLVITSPPYFALRSYSTGHEMEVGSEATPNAYLEALWAATREMVRVLRPSGSIWINLGDKYSDRTGGKHRSSDGYVGRGEQAGILPQTRGPLEKSLLGLPWRYAIGCIDQLSLILRRDLIWSKPNGLPESVTDRPRSSHEYWFMFVKQPRYFAALDELREPHSPASLARYQYSDPALGKSWHDHRHDAERGQDPRNPLGNPLGKLPGSVWSIPSEPLRLPPWIDTQHYAAFPSEWPRRLILAFSPSGICTVCGVGRFPVVDRRPDPGYDHASRPKQAPRRSLIEPDGNGRGLQGVGAPVTRDVATILGYACGCTPYTDHPGTGQPSGNHGRYAEAIADGTYPENFGAGTGTHDNLSGRPKVGPRREYHLDRWTPPPGHPAVVLDPFSGTGTVSHTAYALGRIGIGVDLSWDYCKLATDKTLLANRVAKVQGRVFSERQGVLL